MKSGTADRWERLGALLIQRRTQLSPRFHNRGAFCEATGLKYRLVYDIEEARRTNFGSSTVAAIESAYRLAPGAIGRFLAGGELEPANGTLPVSPAPGPESAAAAGAEGGVAEVFSLLSDPFERRLAELLRSNGFPQDAITAEILHFREVRARHEPGSRETGRHGR